MPLLYYPLHFTGAYHGFREGILLNSSDNRFAELENKFVFQDRAIDKVNEALLDQERRLVHLEATLKSLLEGKDNPE